MLFLIAGLAWVSAISGAAICSRQIRDDCPGYIASGVSKTSTGLTADLALGGTACNIYGNDITDLKLTVNYDSGMWSLEILSGLTKSRQNHDSM